MPPRADNTITKMIAEAQDKLAEIKGIQYFGGDALNLSQFQQSFVGPPPPSGTKDYGWLITMTPDTELVDYTMPLDTQLKPDSEYQNAGNVERVPTTDGTFQWLVYVTNYSGDFPNVSTQLTIIYSGQASFSVQQLA